MYFVVVNMCLVFILFLSFLNGSADSDFLSAMILVKIIEGHGHMGVFLHGQMNWRKHLQHFFSSLSISPFIIYFTLFPGLFYNFNFASSIHIIMQARNYRYDLHN